MNDCVQPLCVTVVRLFKYIRNLKDIRTPFESKWSIEIKSPFGRN